MADITRLQQKSIEQQTLEVLQHIEQMVSVLMAERANAQASVPHKGKGR